MAMRIYTLIAACVICCTVAAGGTYKLMAGKLAAVQADRNQLADAIAVAAKQRKADAAMLARRAAENATAAKEAAVLRKQLDAALRAHREWSDQPVPEEVRRALEQSK